MRNLLTAAIFIVCAVYINTVPAYGDEVKLLSGKKIEGKITKINKEGVWIEIAGAVSMKIPLGRIHSVTRGEKTVIVNKKKQSTILRTHTKKKKQEPAETRRRRRPVPEKHRVPDREVKYPDTMAVWYVDNEHKGTNAGTQSNPFKTLRSLWAHMKGMKGKEGEVAYIKATDTPYREKCHCGDCFGSYLFMDWTGRGKQRGIKQARFYASEAVSNWSQYSGAVFSASFSDGAGIFGDHIYGGKKYDYGVWYIEKDSDIRILRKGPSAAGLQYNQFHWDSSGTLYVNVGEDPDAGQIEACQRKKAVEFYDYEQLYGGIYRFGLEGQHNDGCSKWIVEGIDISYNISHGAILDVASDMKKPTQCCFRRNRVHHNMGRGIQPKRHTSFPIRIEYSFNCIYANGLSGYYQDACQVKDTSWCRFHNNVVYGNNVLQQPDEGGVYLVKKDEHCRLYFHAANNISTNNHGFDFYAQNHADIHLKHISNNAYIAGMDTVGGKWSSSNDRTGRIVFADPENGSFSLGSGSPLINGGRNGVWSGIADVFTLEGDRITDNSGNIQRGVIVDIGAYEKEK